MICRTTLAICIAISFAAAPCSSAQPKYGPGVTDSEIKIGQTMPYSGPASAVRVIGESESAYFSMINQQGGVNGLVDEVHHAPQLVDDAANSPGGTPEAVYVNTLIVPAGATLDLNGGLLMR